MGEAMVLNQEEAVAFATSVDAVALKVASILEKESDSVRRIWFIKNLYNSIDALHENAKKSGVTIACEKGCSFCCQSVVVEVSEQEASLIASHIKSLDSEDQLLIFDKIQKKINASKNEEKSACVFLGGDGSCQIYNIRPSRCRKAHSMNVSACKNNEKNLPQSLYISVNIEALILGTKKGYSLAKCSTELGELSLMLKKKLNF